MTDLFRRHSLLMTVLALVVVSCQLMSISIQDRRFSRFGATAIGSVLSPFETLHHEATLSLGRIWDHYLWLQGVEEERNELKERVKELESQNSRLVESQYENDRLRALLSFRENMKLQGVAAAVVGRDPSNWAKTVTIDRGSADGVTSGQAVVDGNAIVGQTIATSAHSARVLLLTDNTSAIDAIVQNGRAQGIVEGTAEKHLRLRYVLREYAVQVGDRVIASGLDGVFPKGTLIGVVTSVEQAANGLFQNIYLQPSIDTNRLETVLVLQSSIPALETPPGQPKPKAEGKK